MAQRRTFKYFSQVFPRNDIGIRRKRDLHSLLHSGIFERIGTGADALGRHLRQHGFQDLFDTDGILRQHSENVMGLDGGGINHHAPRRNR